MAGPIRGSIEHFFAGSGQVSGSAQTAFINIYNFLNNAQALGVQRLAYNTGSQETGALQFRGMNYYDAAQPAGSNAWAVFRFMSASIPFEMLVQYAGASFGNAPGSPGVLAGGTGASNAIGFSFCQHAAGASCWNGTTKNDGNDVKGSPVWISGSSYAYFPRSNDPSRGGVHGTLKQNMMGFSSLSSQDYRMHVVADFDNFVWAYDGAADNTYTALFFGQYTPISGLTPTIPYFCFADSTIAAGSGVAKGTVAGSDVGGGVSFPNLTASGTIAMAFDRLQTFPVATSQPNTMFNVQRFDEFPLFLGGFESPNQMGLLGQHFSFLREVFSMAPHDTNANGTRMVIGSSNTPNTIKYTIPWHSGTVPGSGVGRGGVQFGM